MTWRVEKRPGFYSDLIWHDWGDDRQRLIAEVHQEGVADQIVNDHNELAAARAQVAAVTAERDANHRCWQTAMRDGRRNLEMRQYWHRRALDAEAAIDDYVDRYGFDENGNPRPSFESLRAVLAHAQAAAGAAGEPTAGAAEGAE